MVDNPEYAYQKDIGYFSKCFQIELVSGGMQNALSALRLCVSLAVSNTKCNSRVDNNTLLCAVINEDLAGPAPAERFTRASIQVQCDRVKLALREL